MKENTPKLTWAEALDESKSHRGATLGQLSQERPTLIVFLRHSGCAFCRETLQALAASREQFDSRFHVASVWMGSSMDARFLAQRYGVEDVHRFVDPKCDLHEAFSVPKGSLYQILGPPIWWAGLRAALIRGHGIGKISGDVFRLAGAIVLYQRKIVNRYDARFSSDCPNFEAMTCEVGGSDRY
jgi:thiol-disulfide isomerase/thioredoxin